jgi:hypothetical protein
MPLCGDILRAYFVDLKNSINCQTNSDLEPIKGFGINFLESIFWNQFFGVISPSDIFLHILEND